MSSNFDRLIQTKSPSGTVRARTPSGTSYFAAICRNPEAAEEVRTSPAGTFLEESDSVRESIENTVSATVS